MYICINRERERERETDRQRETERDRDRDRDRDRESSCRRRSKMHDRAREAAMELEDTVLVEVWVRLESGQGKWSFPRLERKQKNGV